jgi:hypothetical protein
LSLIADDNLFGRVDPVAVVGDMSEDANGADDGMGGDLDVGGLFHDVSQGEADGMSAAEEESEGVSVAVKGALVNLVVADDILTAMPLEKFLFDVTA